MSPTPSSHPVFNPALFFFIASHAQKYIPFQSLNYERIYQSMMKPAYIFDGRKILQHERLQQIGFHVQTIGKKLNRNLLTRSWGSIPQL